MSTSESQSAATPRTKICVYCGAHRGVNEKHLEAARSLARAMAANNIQLGKYRGRKHGCLHVDSMLISSLQSMAVVRSASWVS